MMITYRKLVGILIVIIVIIPTITPLPYIPSAIHAISLSFGTNGNNKNEPTAKNDNSNAANNQFPDGFNVSLITIIPGLPPQASPEIGTLKTHYNWNNDNKKLEVFNDLELKAPGTDKNVELIYNSSSFSPSPTAPVISIYGGGMQYNEHYKQASFKIEIPVITVKKNTKEYTAFQELDGISLYLIALTPEQSGSEGTPVKGEKMVFRYIDIRTGKPFDDKSKVEPLYLKKLMRNDLEDNGKVDVWFYAPNDVSPLNMLINPIGTIEKQSKLVYPQPFVIKLNIADYNGPYILVVVPEIDSGKIKENSDTNKGEIDIPILTYSYIINIKQAGKPEGDYIYTSSTSDSDISNKLSKMKVDITSLVVNGLKGYKETIAKRNLPKEVKEKFLKAIEEAMNKKYSVSVGELVKGFPFLKLIIEKNGELYKNPNIQNLGVCCKKLNDTVKKLVYNKALKQFNSNIGKYYPVSYDADSLKNPITLNDGGSPFTYFKLEKGNEMMKWKLEPVPLKREGSGDEITGEIKGLTMANGGAMLAFTTYPADYSKLGLLKTKNEDNGNLTVENIFYTFFNKSYIYKNGYRHNYILYIGNEEKHPDSNGEVSIVTAEATHTYETETEKSQTVEKVTVTDLYRLEISFKLNTMPLTYKVGVALNDVSVKVDLGAELLKVKYNPELTVKAIPALAPLGGSGFPSTIFGTLEQLNVGYAKKMETTLDNIFGNPIYGLLMPNYIPTPLPIEGLNYVAPGEYVGAIVWVDSTDLGYKIENLESDLGSGNYAGVVTGVLSHLGVGLLSLMFESVNVSLVKIDENGNPLNSNGDVEVIEFADSSGGSLSPHLLSQSYVKLYSYGVGFGESNDKAIGPRIYLVPSSSKYTDIGKMISNAQENVYQGIANAVNENPMINLFKSIVNANNDNKGEKEETLDFGSSIANTAMGIIGGMIKRFIPDLDGIRMAVNYGVYPQLSCYFGKKNSIWPYFLVAPKNAYRFVPLSTGDYMFKVDFNLTVIELRVLKLAFVPIPIPVPRLYKGHLDHKIEDGKLTNVIHVVKMGVLPLYIGYETSGEKESGKSSYFSDIYRKPGDGITVDIYAVPVWMKKDSNGVLRPIAPVLLRGKYRDTGLSIVAATRGGLILDSDTVYFFGLPLKPIKLKLTTLEQLAENGVGYINLSAVWHVGNYMAVNEKSFLVDSIRIEPTKSFVLLGNGSHVLLYTGVYDPDNSIHRSIEIVNQKYTSLKTTLEGNVLEPLKDKLTNIKGDLEIVYNIEDIVNNYKENVEKQIEILNSDINRLITDTINYIIVHIIESLVDQLIDIVVYLVLPLPVNIMSFITDSISDIADKNLEKYFGLKEDPLEEWKDFTLRYGELLVEKFSLTILSNMIDKVNGKDSPFNSMVKQGIDTVDQAIDGVNKAEEMLDIIGYTFQKASDISVYKPMLLAQAEIVTPRGTEMANGFLSRFGIQHTLLAMDTVETNSVEGAVVYVYPYSAYSFTMSLLLGNSNQPGSYVALGLSNVMKYLAAWVNFIGTIYHTVKHNNEQAGNDKFTSIYNKLIGMSDKLDGVQNKIDKYVCIPGLSVNEIILPSVTQVPPVKI